MCSAQIGRRRDLGHSAAAQLVDPVLGQLARREQEQDRSDHVERKAGVERVAQRFVAEVRLQLVGDEAEVPEPDRDAEQVVDEEEHRRRRGPHVRRHEVLDGGDDRAEPHEVEAGRDQEQRERDPQGAAVHREEEAGQGDEERDRGDERIRATACLAGAIREHATTDDAEAATDQRDAGVVPGAVDIAEVQAALEEARQPAGDAVATDRGRGCAEREQPERGFPRDDVEHLEHPRRRRRRRCDGRAIGTFVATALRIAHREPKERRDEHTDTTHDHECPAPAQLVRDQATEQDAERAAERNAERVDRERAGALRFRKVIGDERVRGSHTTRLADADPDACEEDLDEAVGRAAQRGKRAPHEHRDRHDVAARAAIGEPGDRQRERGVEQRERGPVHQPELRIGERELLDHRRPEDREDLAIDEVHHVDEHEDPEHVVAIRLGRGTGGYGGLQRALHACCDSPRIYCDAIENIWRPRRNSGLRGALPEVVLLLCSIWYLRGRRDEPARPRSPARAHPRRGRARAHPPRGPAVRQPQDARRATARDRSHDAVEEAARVRRSVTTRSACASCVARDAR